MKALLALGLLMVGTIVDARGQARIPDWMLGVWEPGMVFQDVHTRYVPGLDPRHLVPGTTLEISPGRIAYFEFACVGYTVQARHGILPAVLVAATGDAPAKRLPDQSIARDYYVVSCRHLLGDNGDGRGAVHDIHRAGTAYLIVRTPVQIDVVSSELRFYVEYTKVTTQSPTFRAVSVCPPSIQPDERRVPAFPARTRRAGPFGRARVVIGRRAGYPGGAIAAGLIVDGGRCIPLPVPAPPPKTLSVVRDVIFTALGSGGAPGIVILYDLIEGLDAGGVGTSALVYSVGADSVARVPELEALLQGVANAREVRRRLMQGR